ncbi:hypothetical protein O3P69_006047 [Scylla paramamosain]|uniref:Uncharacterized protein n=1 Tax=Scylla paramamosain TaxID=85552 RepID=A0AAW0U6W4_SCYPA
MTSPSASPQHFPKCCVHIISVIMHANMIRNEHTATLFCRVTINNVTTSPCLPTEERLLNQASSPPSPSPPLPSPPSATSHNVPPPLCSGTALLHHGM